ncbi:phage tail domain-containing protein [Streptomyces sp. NPDC051662]|uniref:phage tail domain-containing protein n=1 Tax=Streptomyces sp. NPDC051662 TaxID=3154750 RepID=UPI003440C6C3
MPLPAKAAPRVPESLRDLPPVPQEWGRTSVVLAGSNGEGDAIPLTSVSNTVWPGILIQPGATGLDMPLYQLFSDESPNLDGSIFRSTRASAREIMIPVFLYGVDRPTVNSLKRKLFQALNPRNGYCAIRFTEWSGETRQLAAYYKGGMEGAEGDTAGFTWAKYALNFTAMDPYFYPLSPRSIKWSFGTGDPLLSDSKNLFPMEISEGVLGGDGEPLIIENPGDVEAWPVWDLRGPIRSFQLTSSSGATIKASPPGDSSDLIPAGRTLTIDTRPGRKTVRDDRGTNYWERLDTNPEFWPVAPGSTDALITVVTGSGKSAITLLFHPRYASFI